MLSKRQFLFVGFYLRTNDKVQAAIHAGYPESHALREADRLLKHPKVVFEIEQRRVEPDALEVIQAELRAPQLSLRRKLFAENYVKTGNATRSALIAGYSKRTAYSQGHRLLGNADIQRAIALMLASGETTGSTEVEPAHQIGLMLQDHTVSGFVYFISEPFGRVKIGKAINVHARFKTLQTSAAYELKLLAALQTDDMNKLEKEIHARFADKRMMGEWFELTSDDIAEILRDYGKGVVT